MICGLSFHYLYFSLCSSVYLFTFPQFSSSIQSASHSFSSSVSTIPFTSLLYIQSMSQCIVDLMPKALPCALPVPYHLWDDKEQVPCGLHIFCCHVIIFFPFIINIFIIFYFLFFRFLCLNSWSNSQAIHDAPILWWFSITDLHLWKENETNIFWHLLYLPSCSHTAGLCSSSQTQISPPPNTWKKKY